MVVGNQDTGGTNNGSHPSGIPQDQIDNIMRGIANTGDVKMNNHRKKLRQRFDIIKKLGQGTYGKVQLGINKETGQEVAIKTIKKCKIEAEADLVRIRREVQIMSSVQHPNIIHIYEVFENREKMVLVMEFAAGGELYDYLSERKVLSEEEARRIFRQVATAVYYCHKHKICHRDLKLENILLDEHGNAKIADFGLSNVFDEQCLLATFCGSPLYASPEIVEGTAYHGPEVDCWSLGVLLYTLVYGSMPFDGSNFKRLVKQISQGDYYEPKKPSRASSLIREMLTVCPRKRATIEQICSHWWVNENDNVSCLELAEDLANQTPVRLDVLLSLTPVAITADQLVVPSADGGNSGGKSVISRSHSVGSIRDVVPNTEAERRIMDMVAAGGEAALMPSPTRTITPAQSPLQTKRKLENTISTDNAIGVALKKKDKTEDNATNLLTEESLSAAAATASMPRVATFSEVKAVPMETEELSAKEGSFSTKDMEMVDDLCEQLISDTSKTENAQQSANATKDSDILEESPEKSKDASKVIKKFVNKHKTADLVNFIAKVDPNESSLVKSQVSPENVAPTATSAGQKFVRKCSLQDESPLSKFNAERRKSRILETAEKFQQMNAPNTNILDKNKKIIIPGVSVGNFKKEYERKASSSTENQGQQLTAGERRALEQVAAAAAAATAKEENEKTQNEFDDQNAVEASDSKASVSSFSLDEARRSMENSIALLRQAQTESSKDVNQLCAKTENIHFGDSPNSKPSTDRERKLINARAIIGNAIQPVSPQPGDATSTGGMKTSTASITLKSATLPRRKTAKTEIQLDIKPPIAEQPSMRFTTEMQHPVADLRSAPPREGPIPYSPIKSIASQRATSLEPKEHVIPIQRPPSTYTRTISNSTTRSGSLSRQSTNDSESDTTTNMSQATIMGSSQPIKKSPREFIIPIAVEGGGFITPREGSIEPSESSQTSATTSSRSTFTRLRPTRRIGSLLSESGIDEGSPFQKLRTSTSNRDGDDDARFTLHKLRSSRPVKKTSQENDSQSSGEEDDDDGFEILTAENLFSTLLQRVRALTNRMNVNNDISTAFPSSSRLLSNMRQAQSPFWNQEPFGSRLNNTTMNAPWRHSMSRDLGSDMDSMFSRTGATLPRGKKSSELKINIKNQPVTENVENNEEPFDLADLDLSRLRLSKKDLETLSNIAPGLPKCFQEQLLAKLPPTQARKLSRTLSVQTNQSCASGKVYKRSQSSGRSVTAANEVINHNDTSQSTKVSVGAAAERNTDDIGKEKVPVQIPYATNKTHNKSKSNEDNSKDFTSLQNDINEKYKYYSPYINKITKDTSQNSSSRVQATETASSVSTLGRPPSGRISPPAAVEPNTKRPVQRRLSRLIRPDFLDIHIEEISGDQSQISNSDQTKNVADDTLTKAKPAHHIRNKSAELSLGCEKTTNLSYDAAKYNRRSLSRSRDLEDKSKVDKSKLADKILQELQILSSMRSQELDVQEKITQDNIPAEKSTSTVKKVKKIKNKEKSTESSTDGDLKNSVPLVKKVKKIVKKSETPTTPTVKNISSEYPENSNEKLAATCDTSSPKKISKLKRPKSYPMKDSVPTANASEICGTARKVLDTSNISTAEHITSSSNFGLTDLKSVACVTARESRILRPKSYPSSKLIAPKEPKQLIKKINTIEENLNSISSQKSDLLPASCAKLNINSSSSSQIPGAISLDAKKTVKVTKKSKLNSASNTTTTIPNSSSSPGDEPKVSNPALPAQSKEKLAEKKPNKGLLYAIGQKFEKLRASATSNSCANIPSNKKAALETTLSEKSTPRHKSPEIKKTKSLCGNPKQSLTNLEKKSSKVVNNDRVSIEKDIVLAENDSKPIKSDKRSRIDAMIQNLRERSVPRSQRTISSESNYIKRAVSVEEMPGTFNKKSVNKVLGLFKRFEKDTNSENRVRNAHSANNIEREVSKQSPVYQNANAFQKLHNKIEKCDNDTINPIKLCKKIDETSKAGHQTCPGCFTTVENSQEKRKGLMLELIMPEKFQNSAKSFSNSRLTKKYPCYNENEIYSNISPHNKYIYNPSGNNSKIAITENFSNNNISSFIQKSGSCNNNNNNNNANNYCPSLHTSQTSGYRTSSTHEITQNNNLLSPSFENIGNYSSDSRSFQEDCASTSTFLSPTEEAELCFDSWSVCSEDNYRGQRATPSPTVSHLSRASQASSPTRRGCDNSEGGESVVDRIKRRSFYCRFNEKKPKRTSSIVGPNAVREYYREKSSGSRTRSSTKVATDTTVDREHSPDITQEFFRPLKLSPIGTELKPPIYRSSFSNAHDYSAAAGRPRKSLNDIRTPTSPSCLSERRHTGFTNAENELLNNTSTSVFSSRYKSNTYDETPKTSAVSSNLYSYSTYNPKRRFSFTTNSGISAASNNSPQIDGYATLGRRPIRSYDHRTMSLLDSPNTNNYRHESIIPSSTRDYTTSLSRSNSRYRKSSTPRSPTNI